MKVIFILFGFISLCLGMIGIILPILPTTPFLLLTLYLFAKSSDRFHTWFTHTNIYTKYLKSFAENRSMTRKQKWTLMIVVDFILIVTMIIIQTLLVSILIICIICIKHYYFHTHVKMIKKF
jgi:uncharacterized membrane protein YbaN (DUF454 family)